MKNKILGIIVTCVCFSAGAETMPKDQMTHFCQRVEKETALGPVMERIRNGKIEPRKLTIIYLILKNTTEVHIHQQNGATGNQVFILKGGHKEAVYDARGALVKDGINNGSYNYFLPKQDALRHFTFDISPWILWGQSQADPTTVEGRIYAYMGDLEGGLVRALEQRDAVDALSARKWKEDGELQALAVFIKAIEAGAAEELYDLFQKEAVSSQDFIRGLTRLNEGLNVVYK